MEEPNIKKIIKRLQEYSQNLKDNHQIGNSKIVLAFAEMITVMAWSSKQQDKYSGELVNLTKWIMGLTIVMIIGVGFQIYFTYQQGKYTEIQSRSERIFQAQQIQNALSFCSQNPGAKESGIFEIESGFPATCEQVLNKYQKLNLDEQLRKIFVNIK